MDNDGSVKTKNVGQSDLTLPSGCIFGITSHNNSYVIYNISLQRCISADGTNPHLNSTTMNTSGLLYNYYARWIPRGYRTYIEDGVYALQNVNTGLWMDTQYNSYESGKYAQQYNYSQCPADTFSRGGLFKIKQIGDTGRYTVRLMTNNLLTWNVNGGGFKSYKINSVDSAVSVQNTFYIVFDGTGFVLIQCQNNYAMASLANSNASGSAGAPDSYLRRVAKTEIQDNARWNLYKYTGADKCGVTVISNESLTEFNSTGAVAGSTYTFESAVWYTYSSINDNVIVVTPSNSNVADVVWNNSNYTTTVTVKNFGKLSFDVSIWRASSGAPQTLYGARYSYNAVPKEGTYYLQNKYSQKYADVEGPSTADGAVIQQWEFSTASQKKWQVEHVSGSGGYVRLKSLFSNKYLSVDPNDSTKIKQYASPGDNGLWRFEMLDDYSVKVICKSTESSGKVLAIPLNSTSDGVDLTQRAYTDDNNYSDEWYLHMFRDASFVALPATYDRSSFFETALEYMEAIGYTNNFNNHNSVNLGTTKDQLLGYMSCSKITLVRTHGSPTVVEVTDGYLETTDLIALPTNYLSYSELIIYGACKTALGGKMASNLVAATIYAGARTVIGFQNNVEATACNEWCAYFFQTYSLYYHDTSKTLNDVCVATDLYAQENISHYEYTNNNGECVSLRNFVIAGATTFP